MHLLVDIVHTLETFSSYLYLPLLVPPSPSQRPPLPALPTTLVTLELPSPYRSLVPAGSGALFKRQKMGPQLSLTSVFSFLTNETKRNERRD